MSFGLAQPGGGNAVVAAVQWLQGTLLGTVATGVAVISVAAIGLMMLSGRISYRRAGEVVLGCFILFGAASIAAGLQSLGAGGAAADPGFVPVSYAPPPARPPVQSNPDPSADAAVPTR